VFLEWQATGRRLRFVWGHNLKSALWSMCLTTRPRGREVFSSRVDGETVLHDRRNAKLRHRVLASAAASDQDYIGFRRPEKRCENIDKGAR